MRCRVYTATLVVGLLTGILPAVAAVIPPEDATTTMNFTGEEGTMNFAAGEGTMSCTLTNKSNNHEQNLRAFDEIGFRFSGIKLIDGILFFVNSEGQESLVGQTVAKTHSAMTVYNEVQSQTFAWNDEDTFFTVFTEGSGITRGAKGRDVLHEHEAVFADDVARNGQAANGRLVVFEDYEFELICR